MGSEPSRDFRLEEPASPEESVYSVVSSFLQEVIGSPLGRTLSRTAAQEVGAILIDAFAASEESGVGVVGERQEGHLVKVGRLAIRGLPTETVANSVAPPINPEIVSEYLKVLALKIRLAHQEGRLPEVEFLIEAIQRPAVGDEPEAKVSLVIESQDNLPSKTEVVPQNTTAAVEEEWEYAQIGGYPSKGIEPRPIPNGLTVSDRFVAFDGDKLKLKKEQQGVVQEVLSILAAAVDPKGNRESLTVDEIYFKKYAENRNKKTDQKKKGKKKINMANHRPIAYALWSLVEELDQRFGPNTVIAVTVKDSYLHYAINPDVVVTDLRPKPAKEQSNKKAGTRSAIEFYPPATAACVDKETKDTFDVGPDSKDDYQEKVAAAKALCAECPFLDDGCFRQFVIDTPFGYENDYVVAGLTHKEVLAYRRENKISSGTTLAKLGNEARKGKEPDRSTGKVTQGRTSRSRSGSGNSY